MTARAERSALSRNGRRPLINGWLRPFLGRSRSKSSKDDSLRNRQSSNGPSQNYSTGISKSMLRRSFHLALKKAKMTDFHFHDLRHTCATRMVQAGVDLYKVQRLLGHKSPIMTQRYAHHYPESLRDGIEVLDVGRTVSTITGRASGGICKLLKDWCPRYELNVRQTV